MGRTGTTARTGTTTRTEAAAQRELGVLTRTVAEWLGGVVGAGLAGGGDVPSPRSPAPRIGESELVAAPPEGTGVVHVAPNEGDGLHVYPLALQRSGAAHSGREGAVRFRFDHLVSCIDRADPLAALDRLGRIASALCMHPEWSLETLASDPRAGGSGLEVWRALGLVPRPALVVAVPWVVQRPAPSAPPAERVDLQLGPTRSLAGRVTGVGRSAGGAELRAPLAGARVAAPDFGRSTTTDHDGRFQLSGVTTKDGFALHVAARGQRQVVRVDPDGTDPLEIEFDFERGSQ